MIVGQFWLLFDDYIWVLFVGDETNETITTIWRLFTTHTHIHTRDLNFDTFHIRFLFFNSNVWLSTTFWVMIWWPLMMVNASIMVVAFAWHWVEKKTKFFFLIMMKSGKWKIYRQKFFINFFFSLSVCVCAQQHRFFFIFHFFRVKPSL